MQVYVQKSMRTTFPSSSLGVSGGELSQPVAPASDGIWECMGMGPASEAIGPPGLGCENRLFRGAPLAARSASESAATAPGSKRGGGSWCLVNGLLPALPFAAMQPRPRPSLPSRLGERLEGRANLRDEERRLRPGSEMGALGELVVVDERHVRLLRPALRCLVDLVCERAHAHRKLDTPRVEEATRREIVSGIPVEPGRG